MKPGSDPNRKLGPRLCSPSQRAPSWYWSMNPKQRLQFVEPVPGPLEQILNFMVITAQRRLPT